jgi:hypothetical protein
VFFEGILSNDWYPNHVVCFFLKCLAIEVDDLGDVAAFTTSLPVAL